MPTREAGSCEIEERATDGEGEEVTGAVQQIDPLSDAVEVDDELATLAGEVAALAERLEGLSTVTWTNQRVVAEFGPFVDQKIAECASHISTIQARWKKEWAEQNPVGSSG